MDIITEKSDLERCLAALEGDAFVAVDTEFVREKTYYPLLCLIQVAGEKTAFAVDMLEEGLDFKPLADLLGNQKVLKVFHAAQQDLEILLREMGGLPEPLFDTQVAAQLLGYGEAASYGKLVREICEVELDKSLQYTDWAKRPLSDDQLTYAIDDVVHLRKVYTRLREDLDQRGRLIWAEEEMNGLMDPSAYYVDPEKAWSRLRIRSGKPKFLAVAKSLSTWREQKAQTINKPRNWILKDDALLEVASVMPNSLEEINEVRFMARVGEEMRKEIIEVVQKGKKEPAPKLPEKKPNFANTGALVDLLKVLLKAQSEEHQIAASVLARVDDLEQIAFSDTPDVPAMHGWRYEIFGKYAEELKAGKLALKVQEDRVTLVED